jgi:hypothetical protein
MAREDTQKWIAFQDDKGKWRYKDFYGSVNAIKSDLRKDFGKLNNVKVYDDHDEMMKNIKSSKSKNESIIDKIDLFINKENSRK